MAAYQLLIYQMQQASDGQRGDGLMLLAGLGLILTVLYCLGAWGQMKPWFQTYLKLGVNDLRPIGHCHWALANSLGVLAMVSPRSVLGHGLGSITFLGLAAYALAWGHPRSPLSISVKSKGPPSSQTGQYSSFVSDAQCFQFCTFQGTSRMDGCGDLATDRCDRL